MLLMDVKVPHDLHREREREGDKLRREDNTMQLCLLSFFHILHRFMYTVLSTSRKNDED